MVFNGMEVVSGGKGHGGDITEVDPYGIGLDTGTDGKGDGTGVTQAEAEAGTVEELGDVTLRGLDGELIGCKDIAPTGPGGELTRVKGLIPSSLQGVTPT